MSTLSKQLVALFAVIIFSMAMYGCGGGGSSGPAMTTDDDDGGDDDTAMTCPEGQTGTYPDCMDPGPTAEEIAATTKAAGTKRDAIETESGEIDANDAGLGGSQSDGTPVGTYGIAIERDRAGTTIKITDTDLMGDDDPKFAQAEDLGGGTTMHSRMMEADDDGDVVEEVVIVTTDIEAPTATKFVTVYPLDVDKNDAVVSGDDDAVALGLGDALTSADNAQALARVMSDSFTSNAEAQLTFAIDDINTDDKDEAFETAGTYDGAMGMYRCGGTTQCTVSINAMGKITGMSDGWVFTPNSGVTVDVSDPDYLHYGVWLKKTTDKDGVVTYDEVETFAGSFVDATDDVSGITGKATYSGGATGVYVHSVINKDGTEASATSGHFTADAELTAYFGNLTPPDDFAVSLQNTVSGTIDNFMLSGQEEQSWSASLARSAQIQTNTATGETMGYKGGKAGNYQVTFHGGGGSENVQPTSVAGEFDAFFSNGSVAGAFGATKNKQ